MSGRKKIIALLISIGVNLSLLGCQSDPQSSATRGAIVPTAGVAASPQVIEQGRQLYGYSCAACHQQKGQGMEGIGPPLMDSPWVRGSQQRLIRIVMHGVRGPIEVKGGKYNLEMPAMGFFQDQEIAAILTYVRQQFGGEAAPIKLATVTRIRKETADRGDSWTVEELMAIREP
jgi:mono/diheme cytochrome c family protein